LAADVKAEEATWIPVKETMELLYFRVIACRKEEVLLRKDIPLGFPVRFTAVAESSGSNEEIFGSVDRSNFSI
jgi:hypothetical protein